MNLAECSLPHQKLIHFQIVCWLVYTLKGWVPNNKLLNIGHTIAFQFIFEWSFYIEQSQHSTPNLQCCRTMQVGMVSVHTRRMMIRNVELITITLIWLNHNMRCIWVVSSNRIKHVNFYIHPMQVKVCCIKVLGNIGLVNYYLAGRIWRWIGVLIYI
jgi:hypothetical protein